MKEFDVVQWVGPAIDVLGSAFIDVGDKMVIEAVNPDRDRVFVKLANGRSYGWLPIHNIKLVIPFCDRPMFSFSNKYNSALA